MKNTILPVFLFVLGFGFVILSQCFFTVSETEQALVLQFGQPVGTQDEDMIKQAGLHFKLPLIQDVRYFDSRILSVDPQPERVNISSDTESPLFKIQQEILEEEKAEGKSTEESIVTGGEPIIVDTFARYRIVDPLAFLKTLRTVDSASQRIERIMEDATRTVLGRVTLRELLSDTRTTIMSDIKKRVNKAMQDDGLGIEIVDVRIVRADLTQQLRTSTVNRMITEHRERATETRAKGRERALEIRSTAEKEKTVLLAEAEKNSQIMRGEGDKEAIRIYAESFNVDPSFYAFLRTMEAYGNVLSDDETQMILSPDSEFLRYFKKQ
ncbi:MAG: HflC protein [Micavibrio sp.]|nr:HflC protein [Micavibrio sp.]|tara:strand:+ start:1401 stop:2375 length:975 start_codon:yes stop_codon:yes gene_type:complete